MEARIIPVTMADADGARLYRRSLTFLLEAAFVRLFPRSLLLIEHSLASGGYLCEVRGREPLTTGELQNLAAEMRRLVEQNLPICGREAAVSEAIAFFESNHDVEKARSMRHRRQPTVTLYRLGARDDAIKAGRSREIILVSEALHEQHIAEIARQIADRRQQARLVLISGP